MTTLTHGELFAGISGFGAGFAAAGIETRWHVEIDKACQGVLRRHYPETPILDDVRECGAHNLAPVDIITFGSPCQDLSVAGKRAGLEGARSGLFFEAVRIVAELRPTFAVWENVPGALSSNAGRDFAAVLTAFRECGARDIAWRILDAQYFGVAQRRRRVFVVADFGGERAAEILFEPDRGAWDSAPRREAGAGVARAIARGAVGSGYRYDANGEDFAVSAITATRGGADVEDAQAGWLVADTIGTSADRITGAPGRLAPQVSHALRAEGADASEDGTGRGTPLVAFTCKDYGQDAGELAPTLRSMPHDASHENGGGQVAVFAVDQGGGKGQAHVSEELSPILSATMTAHAVGVRGSVRRLTPLECERLQGFPDDWTAGQADSARYRQLGNAVCRNVAEWLGRRIVAVTEALP